MLRSLARRYGYTPAQVGKLTLAQARILLGGPVDGERPQQTYDDVLRAAEQARRGG